MSVDLDRLAGEAYCYLTTTGRTSGEPRTIEIWFVLVGGTAYMMAGGRERSHWVRNLLVEPAVRVRVDGVEFPGVARVLEPGPEDGRARDLLVEKYQPGHGDDLGEWKRSGLPVAVDLDTSAPSPVSV